MIPNCPYCIKIDNENDSRIVVQNGQFYRKSDSQWVQRFLCKNCERSFSHATFHACYRQNKRHKNEVLRRLLCSGVSQRRAAFLLSLSRTTIARKFIFLAMQAQYALTDFNQSLPQVTTLEFDDLETFEHTKCKPLSVTLAVEYKTRRILGFQVSQMPAKGLLAKISVKKYGYRQDHRAQGRSKLFTQIKELVDKHAVIKSDQNPHYILDVISHFPEATYQQFKGKRGCITGQGELKKIKFDPLFSLNHTCAKLRADINRLFRKTWCTTKKADRLASHLMIYAVFHNQNLKLN